MSEQAQALVAHFGPLSSGMAAHILMMNVVAPVAVLAMGHFSPSVGRPFRRLAAPTLAQLALLWGWHAPAAYAAAMHDPGLHLSMQVSLLLAALWFWSAVINSMTGGQWRAIAALLVTSKLFCLLGVLLAFATVPLYLEMAHHGGPPLDPLADQQLAGLLMLVACPMSYLVAAVFVASKWVLAPDAPLRRAESAGCA